MNTISLEIKNIYRKILSDFDKSEKLPEIKFEFYPYVGVNSRIRLRDGVLHIKISDILRESPLEFHAVLAEILLRKLYRKKVSAELSKAYREYVMQAEIREKSVAVKQIRGRKIISGSKGNFYDLEEIFDLMNHVYFNNKIPKPALSWSTGETYRILGHHDSTHSAIVISRSLDAPNVPRFVVEYVVYHEMLHVKHPTEYKNGRRYNHTAAFKRDEKEFAYYEEAEIWIEQNAASIKRRVKRGKRKS